MKPSTLQCLTKQMYVPRDCFLRNTAIWFIYQKPLTNEQSAFRKVVSLYLLFQVCCYYKIEAI